MVSHHGPAFAHNINNNNNKFINPSLSISIYRNPLISNFSLRETNPITWQMSTNANKYINCSSNAAIVVLVLVVVHKNFSSLHRGMKSKTFLFDSHIKLFSVDEWTRKIREKTAITARAAAYLSTSKQILMLLNIKNEIIGKWVFVVCWLVEFFLLFHISGYLFILFVKFMSLIL